MPDPTAPDGLAIRLTQRRGRGVFATRPFAVGDLIERAPVLVIARAEVARLRGTLLDDYWFWWDEEHNACALGCGSLYNHDCPANATFARDLDADLLVFTAVRPIAPGDEITINYNGEPDDPSSVWFDLG